MASSRPSTSGGVPLRPAMKDVMSGKSVDSPSPKAVSIAVPEVSPLIEPLDGPVKKQFSAGLARRLSGRPPSFHAAESSQLSMEELPAAALDDTSQENHKSKHKHHHHHSKSHDKLLTQVAEWLQAEKAKRAAKKAQRQGLLGSIPPTPDEDGMAIRPDSRDSSQGDLSLEKLQRILEDNMTNEFGPSPSASSSVVGSRRGSVQRRPSKKLTRTASSDTEYHDGDVIVPTCDVVLDNSKTLSYGASGTLTPGSEPDLAKLTKKAERERKAWSTFKTEILKLAHTLRLKGWRRIPLENGDDIEVERLSGALTNAVYVVFPPKTIPVPAHDAHAPPVSRRPPAKLLLRIYGPQVEHLIDRENELSILRRLARKKIGPRLLGTFLNGRFEEYFESTTLTARDLRVAETSKQIAKRMRELHDGIELLPSEREEGPFVWKNWDKWVERCEYVISFLDKQVLSGKVGPKAKARGLVCGVEWPVFREVVERYRRLVVEHYGGVEGERKMLVFAHNDTQYGNILRLTPSGTSPLLLPANSHKQLVVIDFEYASANTVGYEFANHFSEWCYNYHDPLAPHACLATDYPTTEEQHRFIRSYVNHRPQFHGRASATPKQGAASGPGKAGSISEFVLDARRPSSPGGGAAMQAVRDAYLEEEAKREAQIEKEVKNLMLEAKLWRVACSAQWVAWGIVQAKVPELEKLEAEAAAAASSAVDGSEQGRPRMLSDPLTPEVLLKRESHEHDQRPGGLVAETMRDGGDARLARREEEAEEAMEEDDEEFSYLDYAHERALFFWGDVLQLGLVKEEDLPEGLRKSLMVVPY